MHLLAGHPPRDPHPTAQACAQEGQLFEQFFPATAAAGGGAALAPLVDPLCTLLYDAVRPALIGVQDIDALCELADILRLEVGAAGWGGDGVDGISELLHRLSLPAPAKSYVGSRLGRRTHAAGLLLRPVASPTRACAETLPRRRLLCSQA